MIVLDCRIISMTKIWVETEIFGCLASPVRGGELGMAFETEYWAYCW